MSVSQEAISRIVAGLKPHKVYLVDYGQRIHQMYPPTQIKPEIFANITVPVALPVAMMLLGLGCALVANDPDTKTVEEPK
jgi:hypothetical protein